MDPWQEEEGGVCERQKGRGLPGRKYCSGTTAEAGVFV